MNLRLVYQMYNMQKKVHQYVNPILYSNSLILRNSTALSILFLSCFFLSEDESSSFLSVGVVVLGASSIFFYQYLVVLDLLFLDLWQQQVLELAYS